MGTFNVRDLSGANLLMQCSNRTSGAWASGLRLRRWAGIAVTLAMLALNGTALAGPEAQSPSPTPGSTVQAVILVERAVVFPLPDRNAEPLTYLFQREQVPVLGKTPDGTFLLVQVTDQQGWILRVQADLVGDLEQVPVVEAPDVPPTLTMTPFRATATPALPPGTGTPPPARQTPGATAEEGTGTPEADDLSHVLPGSPPPLAITLPEGWQQVHILVPFRTYDNQVRDIPLSIYVGPLPGEAKGFIYLYWGFPNVVDLVTGEYNLWADGVQILRGSLVGESCNLGVYDQQTFSVGGQDAVGAFYQASECDGEQDTAGWFATLRVYDGSFAFYTAVEPWNALSDQRLALQSILDSVEFLPPE
jgi:hypothetical protein